MQDQATPHDPDQTAPRADAPRIAKPRRSTQLRLLPPLLLLLVCSPLITYRVMTHDWYWWSHQAKAPAGAAPALARNDARPAPAVVPEAEEVAPEAPPAEALPVAPPAAEEIARPAAPEVAAADPDEAIRQEAEKARAEREELAKFKDKEAERLAKLPPPRPQGRQLDQAQVEEIRKQMEAFAANHRRQFQAQLDMMRRDMADFDAFARGNPRNRPQGLFPPGFDAAEAEIDKFIDDFLRRQHDQGAQVPAPPEPADDLPPPPAPRSNRPAPAAKPGNRRAAPNQNSRTITLLDANGHPYGVMTIQQGSRFFGR